jgi:basic membrane protein A and related proteins
MTRFRIAVALLACVAAVSGCSGDEESAATTGTQAPAATTPAPQPAAAFRVGVVTQAAEVEDPFAGPLARVGLRRAEKLLRVDGRVVAARRPDALAGKLTQLATSGYDLVIGVGSGAATAVDRVATTFPDVDFAVVDASQPRAGAKPPNVRGLLFKEEEAGYLAGYLAGLLNAREGGSKQTIGSVGGREVPWVDRYIAGFRAGARKANPKSTTLNGYSQTFVDQAKCKEIALSQIAQGSNVVFAVAGRCGLGAQSAAEEKNVWAIAVDADQRALGRHILTSAVRRVDVAVFETIQDVQSGGFTGGENVVFDVASGGVDLGEVSDQVPADVLSKVLSVQDDLAAGNITDIPDQLTNP